MAGYCTLVLYFHSPAARENTGAHSRHTQPYCLLSHQIIYMYYNSLLLLIASNWWEGICHSQIFSYKICNNEIVSPTIQYIYPLPIPFSISASMIGFDPTCAA